MLTSPAMKTHVETLLAEISDLYPQMQALSDSLQPPAGCAFNDFCEDDWARHICLYALKRLLIFETRNFEYIETLALLALTRYVFELSVWIRLIEQDRKYSLVYYAQQIHTMRRYYRDQIEHFKREAELFKTFDKRESEQIQQNVAQLANEPDREKQLAHASMFPQMIMQQIDSEAAKHFSVFANDAKTNGYGFQAYLIQTKTVPAAEAAVAELDAKEAEFRRRVPQSVLDLIPNNNRFNWRDMAQRVGIDHEYDFIYTYTSKLLHATPASITTDHPNLELIEVRTFLRYILFTLREMIEIIQSQTF